MLLTLSPFIYSKLVCMFPINTFLGRLTSKAQPLHVNFFPKDGKMQSEVELLYSSSAGVHSHSLGHISAGTYPGMPSLTTWDQENQSIPSQDSCFSLSLFVLTYHPVQKPSPLFLTVTQPLYTWKHCFASVFSRHQDSQMFGN